MCKPRDPRDIANGVIKLLNDDELRLKLGNKARERVLLTFKTEKSVDAYYDSYMKLASKERNPWKHKVKVQSVLDLLEHLREEEYEHA